MNNLKILLLATSVAAGIALASGSAFAADMMRPAMMPAAAPEVNNYVSIFGGAAFGMSANGLYSGSSNFEVPTNTGYVIGGAVGTHIMPNLRGEVEVSYSHHDLSGTVNYDSSIYTATGSFNTLYVLGNLWYDLDLGGPITPYIGGGAGVAVMMPNFSADGDTFTKSAVAPAAQVGAGITYAFSDNLKLDVGYRAKFVFNGTYLGSSSGVSGTSYIDQSVQAGLTFSF
jgi:opacity protein-like surface antigen